METFEGMSPKAAAQVIGGVEEELAVMALSRLTSVKAGKILGNLKADKSARLSEMMAYGKASKRKESARGESNERASASAQ
jgi:flagellar motility protein MotE (MotC chaperone)